MFFQKRRSTTALQDAGAFAGTRPVLSAAEREALWSAPVFWRFLWNIVLRIALLRLVLTDTAAVLIVPKRLDARFDCW